MKSLSTLDMYCESKYHLFFWLSECHQEMIPPLYNALLSGDFPTLTKIVDRAKLWETKNKEARAERDRKRKMRSVQSSKGKS